MCGGGVNRRGRRQHSRNPLAPPPARPLPGHPRAPVRPQRRAGRPPCLSVRAPSWSQGQQPRRRRGPRSNAGSRAPPHTLPSREGPRPTAMVPHTGAWELQTRRHGAHAWRRPAGRAVPPLSRRPSAPCVPASAGPAGTQAGTARHSTEQSPRWALRGFGSPWRRLAAMPSHGPEGAALAAQTPERSVGVAARTCGRLSRQVF